MGDLHSWPNGESTTQSTLLQPYPPNPDPRDITAATWHQAEEAAREVVRHVHPTVLSERRRKEVVSFVQKVLRQFAGAEVCAFGSVPLKTYLPDGDIDLTAIGLGSNSEDNLPNEVKNVLDLEEKKNNNSENKFEVKDVQLIHAEVKLVKCLVQNIIVDISFNQIGGLYTLCFLEQVDQLIGKDHLFKRSIMLIKSWCYYESRILGAHHGLISTYALETLVLYIFHLFHKSLHAPLSVLYRFLDYYSKFDWENYGVSLCGPISLASLPDIIPEQPEIATSELLIQEDFSRQCVDRFQVPARPNEIRAFSRKFLNIVDPLKYGNNLGRSVSKGNFYRIRSAFVFGARKLGQILTSSSSSSADASADVSTFFRNTLERHGSGLPRPDITPLQDELHTLPDANGNIPSTNENENLPEPSRTTPTQTSIYHAPHMFFHNNNNNNNNEYNNDTNTSNNNNDDDDNGLSDLNGEMDINMRNLLYAQQCHEYSSMGAYMMPLPGPLPGAIPLTGAIPIYRGKPPGGAYPVRIPRGYFGPGPGPYYVMNGMPPAGVPGSPGGGYGGEESPKPRGTGTYFPLNNYRPQGYNRDREQNYRDNRERVSPRARNPVSRSNSNMGRSPDPLPVDDSSSSSSFIPASDMQQQQQQQQLAVSNQVVTPVVVPFVPNRWVPMQQHGGGSGGSNNGVGPRQVEFGSLGSVVLPPVVANQGAPAGATTRPVLGPNQRRRNSQMYHLKDDGDFPPLSG